ncbi:MAG: hypothetical protein HYZ73_02355, partial [Elusimicrobia bacterium]|nr:hypothetical protein [Elusimicrobiota bacterium]
VICLTLPNPVFALRQAGLEENAAKQEFLEQIEAPQKTPLNQSGVKEGKSLRNQHQRNQLIALLREHAGGPLDVEEFAQLIGIKKRRLLKLGIEDLISQENARRTTPPPLIIGVHSSPLPAPIKVKPTRKVKPARDIEKAIRDALRSHPGGRLTSKELVKLSGVGKTALFITYNYKALVVEENARRANEIPPRPPIVPLGRNMGRIAIVTALRAHPGGWLRRAELARLAEVKVDMLERHKWRSLVSEENAQRAKERPPRPAIVIDTQTAIIAALAAHPGGPLTVRDLADFAGINLHNNTLPNNSNYRSLVAEENIRRTAEVPPRTPIEIVRQRPSRHSSSFVQTHASIVSALEAFPGGPLTFNQLERSAGVSRQTLRNHDYKRLVDEENARRVTQTPLRLPITLVPPTGTSATLTSGLKENGDKDEVAEYARAVASLEEKLRGLAHRGVAIPTSLTRQTDGKPVRFMGDYRLVDLLREDGESTEELSVEGKEVLILASSTGAYPIAAWRLNAKRVVGIDLDPVSVRVAQFVSGYLHDPNIRAIRR